MLLKFCSYQKMLLKLLQISPFRSSMRWFLWSFYAFQLRCDYHDWTCLWYHHDASYIPNVLVSWWNKYHCYMISGKNISVSTNWHAFHMLVPISVCAQWFMPYAGIILVMGSANERWRYNVTSSLIGWANTQKDPCTCQQEAMMQYVNFCD